MYIINIASNIQYIYYAHADISWRGCTAGMLGPAASRLSCKSLRTSTSAAGRPRSLGRAFLHLKFGPSRKATGKWSGPKFSELLGVGLLLLVSNISLFLPLNFL